jgi:hypothetical protein
MPAVECYIAAEQMQNMKHEVQVFNCFHPLFTRVVIRYHHQKNYFNLKNHFSSNIDNEVNENKEECILRLSMQLRIHKECHPDSKYECIFLIWVYILIISFFLSSMILVCIIILYGGQVILLIVRCYI